MKIRRIIAWKAMTKPVCWHENRDQKRCSGRDIEHALAGFAQDNRLESTGILP
jgi:hypothetical protein